MNNKAVNKNPTTQRESFTELLGQLANNSAAVFQDEIELVIHRIREKVRAARSGILTVAKERRSVLPRSFLFALH